MLNTTFWKKYFEVYDYLNYLIPYSDLIKSLTDSLNISAGDKIFDAGSGTGNLSVSMSQLGADVVGFDFSKEGIEIHKSKQPNICIVQGDLISKLPFSDSFFDKIVSNNAIYTLPKDKRINLFNEFHRILKPGGIIVISNIIKGFDPKKIYIDHLKLQISRSGILPTLYTACTLIVPTLKIFYYNYLIKKENKGGGYDFVSDEEQYSLLKVSGFVNISSNQLVYSKQAILNRAEKKHD